MNGGPREYPSPSARRARRRAYVLLETVIATGLLALGLAMIGAQVQESWSSVKLMDLRVRALMLAEMQLAHLDTGLIEIDTLDEVVEEEFGPQYPSYAWRMTIEETGLDDMYRLHVEVLHSPRRDLSEAFDFEEAEALHSFYVLRARPKALDFAADFGFREDEMTELAEKMSELGIDGLDPSAFDPSIFAKLDMEQLIEVLPVMLDAFGMDVSQFLGALPPEAREMIDESVIRGLLGGEGGGEDPGDGGAG